MSTMSSLTTTKTTTTETATTSSTVLEVLQRKVYSVLATIAFLLSAMIYSDQIVELEFCKCTFMSSILKLFTFPDHVDRCTEKINFQSAYEFSFMRDFHWCCTYLTNKIAALITLRMLNFGGYRGPNGNY
uniref:Uncharacterized protein n=1 Tax=Glossina palpalis gambiensis TaxID=67801 RepID=A0A1B0AS15_9MUSC